MPFTGQKFHQKARMVFRPDLGGKVMTKKATVCEPTADLVRAACREFDEENSDVEEALGELLRQCPANNDLRHVLCKVVVLNRLYWTQIFAVMDVALHIKRNVTGIDLAFAAGSPEIVDTIAKFAIRGKVHNFFSFATKYSSWHNPQKYPIYDSRVDNYLWRLQKEKLLQKEKPLFDFRHEALWQYPQFLEVVTAFRDAYGLNDFTFKEIDKFIWLHGEKPATADT